MEPQIRLFPHSPEEFVTADVLTGWLITSLRARGGRYQLRSRNSVEALAAGSVVLFRHAHHIVGEAVVTTYLRDHEEEDTTLMGSVVRYESLVIFAPSSIRLYSPPLPVKRIQELIGDHPNISAHAGHYYILRDWAIYPRILAEVLAEGGFIH
jgi:hypothetical protein